MYRPGEITRVDYHVYNESTQPLALRDVERTTEVPNLQSVGYVAIEKMVISGSPFPMFKFQRPDPLTFTGNYWIKFKDGSKEYIILEPATDKFVYLYDGIWFNSYQHFCDVLTRTIQDSSGGTTKIDYDETSHCLEITWDGTDNYIDVSPTLARFLQGFPLYPSLDESGIRLLQTKAVQRPEMNLLGNWWDIAGLQVISNMFSIRPEIQGSSRTQGINGPTQDQVYIQAVMDINVNFPENSVSGARGQAYYTPEQPKFAVLLDSTIDLHRMNITVNALLRDGTTLPFILGPYEFLKIKFLFTTRITNIN